MKVEKLIVMSNRVAGFFHSYPDETAAASVRKHLVSFWTADMVAALEHRVERDSTGIDRLVVQAMRREEVGHTVIDRSTSPLAETGVMASDAG